MTTEESNRVYHGTSVRQGIQIARRGEILSFFNLISEQSIRERWIIPDDQTREEVIWKYIATNYSNSKQKNRFKNVWIGGWHAAAHYLDDASGGICFEFDGDNIEQVKRKPESYMWAIPERINLHKSTGLYLFVTKETDIDKVVSEFEKYSLPINLLD